MFSKPHRFRETVIMLITVSGLLYGQQMGPMSIRDSFDDPQVASWNLSPGWEQSQWMDRTILKGENNANS